jgi:hypothetical protein
MESILRCHLRQENIDELAGFKILEYFFVSRPYDFLLFVCQKAIATT